MNDEGDFPGGPRAKTPNAGNPGSTPGQETRYHMLQLRVCMPQLLPSLCSLHLFLPLQPALSLVTPP